MRGRSDGVAHVVQTIEERDQIIVLTGEILRRGDFEGHAIGDAGLRGALARNRDRRLMVVEAVKGRIRIGLGKDYRRRAMTASNVRSLPSGFQFRVNAV